MKTMKKYDLSALLPKASDVDALSRFFIQETAELEKQVVAKKSTVLSSTWQTVQVTLGYVRLSSQ